ncbi:hypothetical protein DEU56DRAFT_117324 [Suillus clintonianus]|uniref:uncharacterized protein n=1 Tax=Suillus clintonianus TaxID=1904413 RepID=UPI001B867F0B|nr:uncharacterized protein DEU56DRAFT_117324 [Suillus clintonianus]KAG2120238.1 hypothetical protein DEU56DRAFT_117324 [Suillus clintonianus]
MGTLRLSNALLLTAKPFETNARCRTQCCRQTPRPHFHALDLHDYVLAGVVCLQIRAEMDLLKFNASDTPLRASTNNYCKFESTVLVGGTGAMSEVQVTTPGEPQYGEHFSLRSTLQYPHQYLVTGDLLGGISLLGYGTQIRAFTNHRPPITRTAVIVMMVAITILELAAGWARDLFPLMGEDLRGPRGSPNIAPAQHAHTIISQSFHCWKNCTTANTLEPCV